MRTAEIHRQTKETDIRVSLALEGKGSTQIQTSCGFLDHMLELFAAHGRFDLRISCMGDTHVDYHHTTEDVGITLGEAFSKALGGKKGIKRYGSFLLPMDESLVLCALDLSGRTMLRYSLQPPAEKVGDFDSELVQEFFWGFVRACPMTLHLKQLDGINTHHLFEAAFKGFGRAMKEAVTVDVDFPDAVPSTKGVL